MMQGANSAHVSVLGSFRIVDCEGVPVSLSSTKSRALFAVLALAPGLALSRVQLCNLFYGDRSERRARGSLRQMLYEMRGELSALWESSFTIDAERVALQADGVRVDVLDFLHDAGASETDGLLRAEATYRGELLADVAIKESDFEKWLHDQRGHLRETAIGVQEELLSRGIGGVAAALKLVALNPLRETSHRLLMSLYARGGESALALCQFEECQALLRQHLGIEPGPETKRLRDEIKQHRGAADVSRFDREAGPIEAGASQPELSVLPFSADVADEEAIRMGDDLAADITTELARFRSLRVIGPTSEDREADAKDAFRKRQNRRYALTGRVRRTGERMRVNLQLVDLASRQTIWGERFSGSAFDPLSLQDGIIEQAVARVESHVAAREHSAQAGRETPGAAAYDYVLRGRFAMHNSRITAAGDLLRRAVALEPGLSDAHAHLALQMVGQSWSEPSAALIEEATYHARSAVEVDPFNPLAHASVGFVLQYGGPIEAAGPACEKALSLNPNDVRILGFAGMWHTYMGEPRKGLELLDRVLERSSYPTSGYWSIRSNTVFQCRDYSATRACLQRGTQLEAWDVPYLLAALAYSDDIESQARLAAVLASPAAADRHALLRHAAYEPYRIAEDKQHLLDGLTMAFDRADSRRDVPPDSAAGG